MKIFGIILILIVFLGGNLYVFHRVWQLMPPSNTGRIILISLAVLLTLSLVASLAFGDSLPIPMASFFYKTGTAWFFIFLYLLILTLLKDLTRLLHIVPAESFTHYTKDNWAGLALAFAFITMLMVCGYLKYRWKVRVEKTLVTEKKMEKRQSLRIVAVSDLHLGYGIGRDELANWIDLINAENSDIVLIAGDIIDNSIRPLRHDSMEQCFRKIKAPLGVYACMGNHEYISGALESSRFIKDAGIHLLKDSTALLDSAFYVVGRDDRSNPRRKPLSDLLAQVDKSKPVILLDHQPLHLDEAAANGIDLQISGHTHHGQVWPLSLVTEQLYEIAHGWLEKGKTSICVTSGIGIWGGKFRIGTQSEYVVINLKQA
ncbi:MAG: metallophosphoesterase [Prevotella sp.]|nr:metallophosphoesterase [Prevotella sp.]